MEVILIIAGALIGIGISAIVRQIYSVGTLRIDTSDPTDGPYMFLELDNGVGDISKRKMVFLKVKQENFISRK